LHPFKETNTMEDTLHHKQLRKQLVSNIRSKGINDPQVLEAIGKVPRHLFTGNQNNYSAAYEDHALEIGEGQTISQPYTVAYQSALLEIKAGERVLEVGTGSGYQSAVLFEMGAKVYTIERHHKLHAKTKSLLAQLGYNAIQTFYGDGNEGLARHAPFDKILVTAAAPGIPAKLVDQLRTGGIMVIPVDGKVQKMLKVTKTSENTTHIEEFDDFRFVPLLEGTTEK
jgi:protein-L-isoaspartate(D-aspartate) O-methyltransferase